MTNRMRPIQFIPEAKNFSDFTKSISEDDNDGELAYEVSDGGGQVAQMISGLQADEILIELLMNLDNRDKIILLYQVLRGMGFGLQHEECAKTLSLSRGGYLVFLKKVTKKCEKILQGYRK